MDETIGPGYALQSLKGQALDRTCLATFAGGSGDLNPIHIDLDFARSAGYDDVFAHGMLAMAVVGRLLTAWVPQEHIRSFRSRFVALTPVGSRPICSGSVVAVEDREDERLATVELVVTLEDGTVTVTGEAVVALPKASI